MAQQITKEQNIPHTIKMLNLPALGVLPFVTEKDKSGKDVKIPNKDFRRESFEEVISALASTKSNSFQIYAGYKETTHFPKFIEALTRIATSPDYQKIPNSSFDYQEAAKKVLINFLGLVPGKHSITKETDAFLKKSFDKNNDLETNKAIFYALARKNGFSLEDQKFISNILNDTKTYKEDLRKAAISALGLSIVENFESKQFGLSYLQEQVKSLNSKDDNYSYKVKYLSTIIKTISVYMQPDILANHQEGKLTIELSKNLSNPENTTENFAHLLAATTMAGINKNNYLRIKENFEKSLKLLETKDCKVPENERPEIKKSIEEGIKVIDKFFINPKLPPPQPKKGGMLA